jgi:DNA-binding Lrp family transcriptional regulator
MADGRIRVPRSQAALADEAGCSAGTIAYYLRVLGDAVSTSRREGLIVDPRLLGPGVGSDELARRRRRSAEVADVLATTWGHIPDSWGRMELADDNGRAPTVREMAIALGLNPSTTQRHLENLSREGRLERHCRHL